MCTCCLACCSPLRKKLLFPLPLRMESSVVKREIYWAYRRWRPIIQLSLPQRSLKSRRFSLQIHHRDGRGGAVATVLLLVWWLGNKLHSKGKVSPTERRDIYSILATSLNIWMNECCYSVDILLHTFVTFNRCPYPEWLTGTIGYLPPYL